MGIFEMLNEVVHPTNVGTNFELNLLVFVCLFIWGGGSTNELMYQYSQHCVKVELSVTGK